MRELRINLFNLVVLSIVLQKHLESFKQPDFQPDWQLDWRNFYFKSNQIGDQISDFIFVLSISNIMW